MITGTPKTLRRINEDAITQTITMHGPITKVKISKLTNLSLVTVSKIVEQLLSDGILVVTSSEEPTGGRLAQAFTINTEIMYYIGLYFYIDTFYGVLTNYSGEIIQKDSLLVDPEEADILPCLFKIIDNLINVSNNVEVRAIAIGVPGVVKNGIITSIPTIPSWEEINLKKIINEKYNIQVFLENDINTMVLGEYITTYKEDKKDLVLIYLEKGIGSGVIIGGEIHRGFSNFAGEISANIVYDKSKQEYVNFENKVKGLLNKMKSSKETHINEFLEILSLQIINIITLLNPEVILIQHNILNNKDIKTLNNLILKCIDENMLPSIKLGKNLVSKSLKALIDICMLETSSGYFVKDEKWR